MMEIELSAWAALSAGILLIVGGVVVLIGSLGLLRLPDSFSRMHPPTMGATLGAGCILFASMLASTAQLGRPIVHELLITLSVVMTAPVTSMILTRAVLYRMRRNKTASTANTSDSTDP